MLQNVMRADARSYTFQATVIEARGLPLSGAGSQELFVRITVAAESPQTSVPMTGTTAAEWSQTFTFENVQLSAEQLERFEARFDVLGLSRFLPNALIGTFSLGLSSLYKHLHHTLPDTWLTLSVERDFQPRAAGYLRVNCFLLAADDEPPPPLPALPPGEAAPEGELRVLAAPRVAHKNYQLQVTLCRAEGLPVLGLYRCDSFVSVRVGETVMRSPVVEASQSPKYSCRVALPLRYPFLHDKVVVKVWDRNTPRDRLIANVPENFALRPLFDLNRLLSAGGTAPCQWICLYGVGAADRLTLLERLRGSAAPAASSYLGRLLMGLSLLPAELPEKAVQFLVGHSEPDCLGWTVCAALESVSLYVNCAVLSVQASWGGASEKWAAHKPARSGQACLFEWPAEPLFRLFPGSHPNDPAQMPDFVLSFFEVGGWGERKLGFCRIPADDDCWSLGRRRWHCVRALADGEPLGAVLLELRRGPTAACNPRLPPRSLRKLRFFFLGWLFSGVCLAPAAAAQTLSCGVYFQGAEVLCAAAEPGHYAEFRCAIAEEVELGEGLEAASEVEFFLYGRDGQLAKGSLRPSALQLIKSVDEFALRPVCVALRGAGSPQGRLLGCFALMRAGPKTAVPRDELQRKCHLECVEQRVKFTVVGVRNAPRAFKDAQVVLRVPHYDLRMELSSGTQPAAGAKSFNVLRKATAKVRLPVDHLFWPWAVIEVCEAGETHLFAHVGLIAFGESAAQTMLDDYERLLGFALPFRPPADAPESPSPDQSCVVEDEGPWYVSVPTACKLPSMALNEEAPLVGPSLGALPPSVFIAANCGSTGAAPPAADWELSALAAGLPFAVECTLEDKRAEIARKREQLRMLKAQLSHLRVVGAEESVVDRLLGQIAHIKKSYVSERSFAAQPSDHYTALGRPVARGGRDSRLRPPYWRVRLRCRAAGDGRDEQPGHPLPAVLKFVLSTRGLAPRPLTAKNFYSVEHANFVQVFELVRSVKIRFYLLRATSLAAQETVSSLQEKLAGHTGISSTNAYPVLRVGAGRNDAEMGIMRMVSDPAAVVANSLHPEFNRCYELDAVLPEDALFSAALWHQNSLMPDAAIGAADFDIEDAFFARKSIFAGLTERLLASAPGVDARLLAVARGLEPPAEEAPIECTGLRGAHGPSRGVVEFVLEVLSPDEHSRQPPLALDPPKRERFELRLVVYSIAGLEARPGRTFDYFVQAKVDQMGWRGGSATAQTDLHMGSADGAGVFNWRMKFALQVPCPFPRVKLSVFDFATFSADRSLAEVHSSDHPRPGAGPGRAARHRQVLRRRPDADSAGLGAS